MLRQAQLGCEITAVTMTSGEREARNAQGWNVPKRDLMAGVQVLLEHGELKISAKMPHVRTLWRWPAGGRGEVWWV